MLRLLLLLTLPVLSLSMTGDVAPSPALRDQVIAAYASTAASSYREAADTARVLLDRVKALVAAPDEATLAAAREAWCAARRPYEATEVYRYGDGPIDRKRGGVENFVNAWPVDENYIEPAERPARTGIIADRSRYPVLARAVLREHNQRGGETNVCTGWHAIEFMLWGRDTSETGPGDRPASDFVSGTTPHAERRREYLLEITTMLHEDLQGVAAAWQPGPGSHREKFVSDPARALRAMFIGPALLTGFEMAGERLAVALESHDQEEEHSCFSDTTDADFKSDMRGVVTVLRGVEKMTGLIDLVRSVDAAQAAALEKALDETVVAVNAMPHPFDASIRAPDTSPQHAAMVSAMHALERLSEQVSASARALGVMLPTQPQG